MDLSLARMTGYGYIPHAGLGSADLGPDLHHQLASCTDMQKAAEFAQVVSKLRFKQGAETTRQECVDSRVITVMEVCFSRLHLRASCSICLPARSLASWTAPVLAFLDPLPLSLKPSLGLQRCKRVLNSCLAELSAPS